MSYLIAQSLEHAPDHRRADGDEIPTVELFLDFDPVLPSWPPEAPCATLPQAPSDDYSQ